MNPSELRQRMVDQHDHIRTQLDRLELLSARMLKEPALRSRVESELAHLRATLVEHMRDEEEEMLPELLAADGFGAARVADVKREHALQRQVLDTTLAFVRSLARAVDVYGAIQGLVDRVRDEMAHEERLHFGVLRDSLVRTEFIG